MRIRTIKPEFWQNEKLGALSRELRMFAAALLNVADDEGYFRTHPALIAGAVLPFDSDGQRFVKKALPELARIGFIELFDGGVGRVPKFSDHQRLSRVTPSRLKDKKGQPLENSHLQNISGNVSQPQEMFVQEVEVEVEVEQGSGRGTGSVVAPSALGPCPEDLQNLWNSTTTKPHPRCSTLGDEPDSPRRVAALAALKRRSLSDWKAVFQRINVTAFCRGDNDRKWIANFDWAIRSEGNKPEVATKVLEGAYDNGTGPPKGAATSADTDWSNYQPGDTARELFGDST